MNHKHAILGLGLAFLFIACAPSDESTEGSDATAMETENVAVDRYGEVVSVTEITPIQSLNEQPADFLGQAIRIEGKVTGVCKGSGCWVRVEEAGGSTIIAKSLDHSVAVPTDCEGRTIVVQGFFKNMAEPEGHKPGTDHAEGEEPHECPQPEYLLTLEGAELVQSPAS